MTTETKDRTQTKVVATQQKALVKWKGERITVTFHDVKNLICPLATDQETVVFLKTCQSLQLNPFAGEVFLIKYSEKDKAGTVISISSYLKAAEANENYAGSEAGIILRGSGGALDLREGAFLFDDEADKLAGGWARVYRKDRDRPTYIAVNKAECIRYTREGKLTQFWTREKQPSMLRKTALKRALVEAFPSLFAGTMSSDEAAEPPEVQYEMPENEVPPAFEKGGQPDWKKFWARVKSELGLTTEQARELLQVASIKEGLIDQGWTIERIWDELIAALQRQKATAEGKTEQIVDTKTGEIITQDEDLFSGREEEAGTAAPAEAQNEEPTGVAAPAKPKRDPESIKTINDLLKACNLDFKMQPKDVYAELNVKSASEIKDLPSSFRRIQAARV